MNEDQSETAPRLEQWESVVQSRIGLNRYDRDGRPTPIMILGRQSFHMSPDERRLNQALIVEERHDPFKNGSFRLNIPVDDEPDSRELAGNRETMSDADVDELIDMKPAEFVEFASTLTSPVTVRRILNRCLELEAGPARVNALRELLKQLDPNAVLKGDDAGMTASERTDQPVQLPPIGVDPEGRSRPRQYASLNDLS